MYFKTCKYTSDWNKLYNLIVFLKGFQMENIFGEEKKIKRFKRRGKGGVRRQ